MKKLQILIIEDDVDFTRGVRELLELEGYEVSCATTGKRGLELAFNDAPDLVLLDVMMEHTTSGFETCREMRRTSQLKNVPIILVTGICSELNLPFHFEPDDSYLPVTRIIEKPVEPKVLLKEIRTVLANNENKTNPQIKETIMKNKALVIDDNKDFAASMKFFLTTTGYDVITANNGETGYTEAVAERPNFIFLDVMMENCSAGLDTVRRLRDDTDTAEIPVFMITGIRKPEHLLGSYGKKDEAFPNVKGVFEKPVVPEKLMATMEKWTQDE